MAIRVPLSQVPEPPRIHNVSGGRAISSGLFAIAQGLGDLGEAAARGLGEAVREKKQSAEEADREAKQQAKHEKNVWRQLFVAGIVGDIKGEVTEFGNELKDLPDEELLKEDVSDRLSERLIGFADNIEDAEVQAGVLEYLRNNEPVFLETARENATTELRSRNEKRGVNILATISDQSTVATLGRDLQAIRDTADLMIEQRAAQREQAEQYVQTYRGLAIKNAMTLFHQQDPAAATVFVLTGGLDKVNASSIEKAANLDRAASTLSNFANDINSESLSSITEFNETEKLAVAFDPGALSEIIDSKSAQLDDVELSLTSSALRLSGFAPPGKVAAAFTALANARGDLAAGELEVVIGEKILEGAAHAGYGDSKVKSAVDLAFKNKWQAFFASETVNIKAKAIVLANHARSLGTLPSGEASWLEAQIRSGDPASMIAASEALTEVLKRVALPEDVISKDARAIAFDVSSRVRSGTPPARSVELAMDIQKHRLANQTQIEKEYRNGRFSEANKKYLEEQHFGRIRIGDEALTGADYIQFDSLVEDYYKYVPRLDAAQEGAFAHWQAQKARASNRPDQLFQGIDSWKLDQLKTERLQGIDEDDVWLVPFEQKNGKPGWQVWRVDKEKGIFEPVGKPWQPDWHVTPQGKSEDRQQRINEIEAVLPLLEREQSRIKGISQLASLTADRVAENPKSASWKAAHDRYIQEYFAQLPDALKKQSEIEKLKVELEQLQKQRRETTTSDPIGAAMIRALGEVVPDIPGGL